MSILDRFGAAWRAFTEAAPADPSPFREAAGRTIEDEDEGWRRLTGDQRRDLQPMQHARMLQLASYLWQSNPLANRLIELPVAYLVAEGVRLACKDPDAQRWLNAFWVDPINKMGLKLPRKVRELALFGEQCWPAYTNAVTGHVRLGYLDPAKIETVVSDPDNVEQPIGVISTRDAQGRRKKWRVIVNGPEQVFSARTQQIRDADFPDGECFLFQVNAFSNGARGRSDILSQIDWLDAYDQYLFGELERAKGLRSWMWDVTLAGATEDQVRARASKITAPRAGAIRVHNEAETWRAVAADLDGADGAAAARLFRNQILGGGTIPEHWFGGGGDVNRATAGEMGDPTYKVLAARQAFLRHMLEELGTYQIRQRLIAAGRGDIDPADPQPDLAVSAEFPDLVSRDLGRITQALQATVATAAQAISEGLLTERTALAIIALAAARLGVTIDPEAELAAAREEAAGRAADRDINPPPFAAAPARDGAADTG
ncbi:MAG: hypothetical protein OHK0024_24320 [Thalassobaculales bacterium]